MNNAPVHPATAPPSELLRDCQSRRVRRSGPGGQHRNKVETGIVLTHTPTQVSAEASERRSQADNKRVAVARLRVNLALQVRTEVGESPSACWESRCKNGRVAINPNHDDFPTLLAEVLNVLQSLAWNIGDAAEFLGVSTSQLTKFLKLEPRALQQVNVHRNEIGLKPLKQLRSRARPG